MPEADIDRIYDYEPAYIADILKSVKTIAMVGASPDKTKFSYGVLRVLHETRYDMIPVNPRPELTEIRGIRVYHSVFFYDGISFPRFQCLECILAGVKLLECACRKALFEIGFMGGTSYNAGQFLEYFGISL